MVLMSLICDSMTTASQWVYRQCSRNMLEYQASVCSTMGRL